MDTITIHEQGVLHENFDLCSLPISVVFLGERLRHLHMGRGDNRLDYADGYYRGTQANLKVLAFDDASPVLISMACWLSIVCPVGLIVSLPVDLVIDTALFPADYYREHSYLPSRTPTKEPPTEHTSQKSDHSS